MTPDEEGIIDPVSGQQLHDAEVPEPTQVEPPTPEPDEKDAVHEAEAESAPDEGADEGLLGGPHEGEPEASGTE